MWPVAGTGTQTSSKAVILVVESADFYFGIFPHYRITIAPMQQILIEAVRASMRIIKLTRESNGNFLQAAIEGARNGLASGGIPSVP